ncbi:hypothetical protein C8R44DRAFT_749787 [Mycena epipterygia]|nr:hypothetical protein C8R44DRAFT_749787 [Mycena epipterygia]
MSNERSGSGDNGVRADVSAGTLVSSPSSSVVAFSSLYCQIDAKIRSEHRKVGLVKTRQVRHNHNAASTLLDIPRYTNLFQDQDDEDPSERGWALVQSAEGWRTEMARWIADAQEAEAEEDEENDEEDVPVVPNPPRLNQPRAPRKWQPISLEHLFAKTAEESLRARHGKRMVRESHRTYRIRLAAPGGGILPNREVDALMPSGHQRINAPCVPPNPSQDLTTHSTPSKHLIPDRVLRSDPFSTTLGSRWGPFKIRSEKLRIRPYTGIRYGKIRTRAVYVRRFPRAAPRLTEEEQMYMQVMAELDAADNTPDDGEVEIDDLEVYGE